MTVYVCLFSTCVPGPCGDQKRSQIPWNRRYRQLWATVWILESTGFSASVFLTAELKKKNQITLLWNGNSNFNTKFSQANFLYFPNFPSPWPGYNCWSLHIFQYVKMILCEVVFSLGITMILMFLGKQIPLRWVSQQLQ